MARLPYSTIDKRMRDLGFRKEPRSFGRPRYTRRVDFPDREHSYKDNKTKHYEYLIIQVELYSWYQEGFAAESVAIEQHIDSYYEGPSYKGGYQTEHKTTSITGPSGTFGLRLHYLNELMEILTGVQALMKEGEKNYGET